MNLDDASKKELIAYNLEKAKDTAADVEFLIQHGKLAIAVNRIYYGLFYALTALALHENHTTAKHSELIGWFNKNFVKTSRISKELGAFLHRAFDDRSEADYGSFVQFDSLEVKNQAEKMKVFIARIGDLIIS